MFRSVLALVLAGSALSFGCDAMFGIDDGKYLAPEYVPDSVEVAERDDGAAVLTAKVDGKTRVLDTVGGTIAATRETNVVGSITVRHVESGVVSWFWHEARTRSPSTGGTRFAVWSGDTRVADSITTYSYGHIYDIANAERVDGNRVVLVAFSDHGPNDYSDANGNPVALPNIRVLDVVAGAGIAQDIAIEGIMADELIDVLYDSSTNAAHVLHSYHGVADESVVQL